MGSTTDRGADRHEHPSGTLGALLYSDPAKPRLSEEDWAGLVRAIAASDPYALRALYERTHRLVFTLIVRITDDRETAEELTLDVFHDVWRQAGRYDAAGGTVVGWIMNRARSRALDRLRFDQRKKRTKPPADDALPPPVERGPHETLGVQQQARLLRDTLTVLTPEERQAIEVAFFSELTHSQVAAQLSEPLGTIKTRIRSGLQKLRQALEATGEVR